MSHQIHIFGGELSEMFLQLRLVNYDLVGIRKKLKEIFAKISSPYKVGSF